MKLFPGEECRWNSHEKKHQQIYIFPFGVIEEGLNDNCLPTRFSSMINSTPSTPQEEIITEFTTELESKESTFTSGDKIEGHVNIRLGKAPLTITSLRMSMQGIAKVLVHGKKEESCQESFVYLKKDWILIQQPTTLSSTEQRYPFQETLPDGLPSSVYTTKGHILYSLTCTLDFLNRNDEAEMLKSVCGFTVIEAIDLNNLPRPFFESKTEIEQRKFGLFSCTGGHIRLSLTMERFAFVCGEGVVVVGRIENKSDRHIDKVSAVLQRRTRLGSDVDNHDEVNHSDISDVQEDMLAMYVIPGSNVRIDKKLHLPSLSPSSPISQHQKARDDLGIFHIRRRSHTGGRLSIASTRSIGPPNIRRLINVTYNYIVRVKCGGADLIEIVIPIIIGSKPLTDPNASCSKDDGSAFPGAIFKQSRTDRGISLIDDKVATKCDKSMLTYFGKYPIYPDLATSAKQTKKLCVVAGNLRAENRVLQIIRPHPVAEDGNASTGSTTAREDENYQ